MHVQGRSLHTPGASLPVARRSDTMEECANQCCHNELDATKGRQLPMHIGSPSLHCQYVKSNLGQQVPAANGAAYAMKLMNKQRCAITYFGEGCASEGDIPSALNIAAVHGCPTIFFCRNNGYAISTHTDDQYKSDGIAPRGMAFGMPCIRVDGNDSALSRGRNQHSITTPAATDRSLSTLGGCVQFSRCTQRRWRLAGLRWRRAHPR